jgi:hypothetical protein
MMKTTTLLLAAGLATATPALAQQSTDEVRAMVSEMMNDADSRTSLLAGGDAGHDGKFFIAGDGFRLNVGGQLQFRYLVNVRDNDSGNDDDFSNGFQTRRTKLDFNGEVNKDWFFRVLISADRSEGSVGLEEAFAGYKFANGWKARWGQFKLPMLREELVSSSRQLAVERSLVNEVFTQDRSQGIEAAYATEQWRLALAFSDGLDSENTDFNDSGPNSGLPIVVRGEAEYAFTARAEFMISGNDWKMWEDFTSKKGQDFGFLLGVAAHYQVSTQTPDPADVDTDTLQFTVDASLEGDSWNAFAAFIYRWQEQSALGAGDTDLSDMGFVLQGGWRFAENTELFARYESLIADSDRFGGGEDTFNFLTLGINQYYAGHAAKATLDMVWSFEETSNLAGTGLQSTGNGLLGDVEENEIVFRAQFQLLF